MGEGGTEGRSRKNRGGGKADRPLVNLHGKCIKDWLSPPPPPSVSTLFLSSPFLRLSQLFFQRKCTLAVGGVGVLPYRWDRLLGSSSSGWRVKDTGDL